MNRPYVAIGGARAAFACSQQTLERDVATVVRSLVVGMADPRTKSDVLATVEDLRRLSRLALAEVDRLTIALVAADGRA